MRPAPTGQWYEYSSVKINMAHRLLDQTLQTECRGVVCAVHAVQKARCRLMQVRLKGLQRARCNLTECDLNKNLF